MFNQNALIDETHKLHKFALRLTKNTHNAEDLVQSTLVRALEKKELFEGGTNLFSWTSKIMFNLFISGYRRRKKFETQYDPEPYINLMSVAPVQEACVDFITVSKNMEHLSPEHREVLVLVCVKGMSYSEAAMALNIPENTVRSRLSRARDNLQEILAPTAPHQTRAHLQALAA